MLHVFNTSTVDLVAMLIFKQEKKAPVFFSPCFAFWVIGKHADK